MTNPAGNQITPHFSWDEVRCPCGKCQMPADVPARLLTLCRALEELRFAVGKPIHLTKRGRAYRCPDFNKEVGGASRSQHLTGRAADLWIEGMSGDDIRRQIEALIAEGLIPEGGIGTATTWAHYDIRGIRRRWRY